jgi:hypothetical protein
MPCSWYADAASHGQWRWSYFTANAWIVVGHQKIDQSVMCQRRIFQEGKLPL